MMTLSILTFGVGLISGMYISSQIETHVENKVNPKIKRNKKMWKRVKKNK
jgi:uncharacterized protein YneF (UPF0154 family)